MTPALIAAAIALLILAVVWLAAATDPVPLPPRTPDDAAVANNRWFLLWVVAPALLMAAIFWPKPKSPDRGSPDHYPPLAWTR